MEMGDQYGLPDLRQLMAGATHFPAILQTTEILSIHQNLTIGQHYEMTMMNELFSNGVVEFRSGSCTAATPITTPSTSSAAALFGLDIYGGCVGGDGNNSRWPRQETLTLLEIRSCLDPRFKEANQKGPLWDEVSRIMLEEYGYQRSGKKCKEKFENLYKYYKKTKGGKAGRQDGKHYRFFHQLESLYGDANSPISEAHHVGKTIQFSSTDNTGAQANQEALQAQKLCESHSISNSFEFYTSSLEDNDNDLSSVAFMEDNSTESKKNKNKEKMNDHNSLRRGRKNWEVKIRDFIDSQMRKLMETQETLLEKILNTLEHKEQERMSKEEEWRKLEVARFDQVHKIWARERAWIEARDAALMEAFQNLSGNELKASSQEELMAPINQEHKDKQNENRSKTLNNVNDSNRWLEPEISSLIELRSSMESRLQQSLCLEWTIWEEIAAKMAYLGYDRSAFRCKEKWENINYFRKAECNEQHKENPRKLPYFQSSDSLGDVYCHHDMDEQRPADTIGLQPNDDPSPSNSIVSVTVNDSCFPFLMPEGEKKC